MSHRHYCDYAGHDWQCAGDCECICGLPMEGNDHSECPVELRACPEHSAAQQLSHAEATSSEPMKGRIKIPPRRKLVRALRRASRAGFVGACVWCGHGYKRFSLKIQEAHLKECAEYQRAKRCSPKDR